MVFVWELYPDIVERISFPDKKENEGLRHYIIRALIYSNDVTSARIMLEESKPAD